MRLGAVGHPVDSHGLVPHSVVQFQKTPQQIHHMVSSLEAVESSTISSSPAKTATGSPSTPITLSGDISYITQRTKL
uniref:Uncharacterized protein n=1 Tax=Kalanchoe fedtschenkoi TaxID=63787 RepID=A0A7N1A093_KALFE